MSISNVKKIILVCTAIFFITAQAQASEKTGKKVPRASIVIYNFKPAGDSEKYHYYANIIPHTISHTLKKKKMLTIKRSEKKPGMFPVKSNRKIYKKWTASLTDSDAKDSPDYAIAGTCRIVDVPDNKKLLEIRVQVINIRGRESAVIETRSEEVGAILKTTIDGLSAQIDGHVRAFQLKNMERFAPSPFLPLYSIFRGVSFGFKTGRVYLTGDWGDLYNDSDYINPYITINTTGRFSLTLNGRYFSTDNEDIEAGNYSILSVWSGSADIAYHYLLSRYFHFSFAAGGGLAVTNIQILTGHGPFDDPLVDTNSTDPFAEGAIAFNMDFLPVCLQFGAAYRVIFFQDTNMKMFTLFFGAGFKI